jgi:hypothetical protein
LSNTEGAWKALQQVNEWIRFADAKAGAILAGSAALGGVVLHALPQWSKHGEHPWQFWLLIASLVAVTLAILFALRVLAPALRAGEPRSLVYFDHIARKHPSVSNYVTALRRLLDNEDDLVDQLGHQIWANSRVARHKFVAVGRAVRFLGLALILAGIGALLQGR